MKNIFWVTENLAFSPQVIPEDFQDLFRDGIGAVVSLTISPLNKEDFPGFELFHLPMEEKVPSLSQIQEFLSFLRLMRTMKRKVLVHCYAGLERSPTMVASYLISSGMKPQEAISRIRYLRPEAINQEEEQFLNGLPSLLKFDCPKDGESFENLLQVMRTLRKKCPWDKEQSHQSLAKYLIEESWELQSAIGSGDPEKIKDELGDVLLQVVFHAVIGEESGDFTVSDVIYHLIEKLVRRHPHVFSSQASLTPDGVKKQWEELKSEEGRSGQENRRKYMPALLRAERIQESASVNGFDWESPSGILEKFREEMGELEALLEGKDTERMREEIGDLLFTLVNLSRFLKINPEEALHLATDKFLERYEKARRKIQEKGLKPSNLSPEEIDGFWEEAKREDPARDKHKGE